MKQTLTLGTKILATRKQLLAITKLICDLLAEEEEDYKIANIILDADSKLDKAMRELTKEN